MILKNNHFFLLRKRIVSGVGDYTTQPTVFNAWWWGVTSTAKTATMAITLDGFGSHLEGRALQVFADHKILIIKEEGDTSQVCQAYDKDVAKADKRHHRNLLNGIRLVIPIVDCWNLVFVANAVCKR